MVSDPRGEKTLAIAEDVARILKEHNASSAIIGGIALAIHGYPRATRDLDLGTNIGNPSTTFPAVATILRKQGLDVHVSMPDDSDPLGGVMTVRGDDFDPVQVVNFYNPMNASIRSPGGRAVRDATLIVDGSDLKVVDLDYLIALKLFAGGRKSELDVLELLAHNEDADLAKIQETCTRFGLGEHFEEILSKK